MYGKESFNLKIFLTKDTPLEELVQVFSLSNELIKDANINISDIIKKDELIEIPGWIKDKELNSSQSECKKNIIYFEYPNDLPLAKKIPSSTINSKKCYDFFALQNDLQTLLTHYPFVKKRMIGQSVLGQPIYELIIGKGKRRVHMNGAFHANEWITSAIMMKWLDQYLNKIIHDELVNGYRARNLYNETTLSFVPMVNPDGVNLVLNRSLGDDKIKSMVVKINNGSHDFSDWKANIRGVDLNNQYPAFWEIEQARKIPKSPASRDFPGNRPLTEPESIAMEQLVKNSNFDRIIAFHTQGEEIYWGYLNYEPEESEKIVNEFVRLSNYKAVRNIDSHAGFRDWFIYQYRKPGFTVELGLGVNPLPLSQFNEIFEKSKGIFAAALYM